MLLVATIFKFSIGGEGSLRMSYILVYIIIDYIIPPVFQVFDGEGIFRFWLKFKARLLSNGSTVSFIFLPIHFG